MEKSKLKELTQQEAYELVQNGAQKAHELIIGLSEGVEIKQRWLIFSRTLNLLFGTHYKLSMEVAEKEILQNEKAPSSHL